MLRKRLNYLGLCSNSQKVTNDSMDSSEWVSLTVFNIVDTSDGYSHAGGYATLAFEVRSRPLKPDTHSALCDSRYVSP